LVAHPFLWDRGVLTDLGTLGGTFGFAAAINDAGEIVGYASVQGDQAIHGFLWKNGVKTALGTLDSDQCNFAFAINSKGQVLGGSLPTCTGDESTSRGTLSEDGGPMVDLNTLVPPGSALRLTLPLTINDRGEIAGVGVLPNGDAHAFLLIPCQEGDGGCGDAAEGTTTTQSNPGSVTQERTTATPPNPAMLGRGMLDRLRTRRFPWYHFARPGTGPTN
jgi:probable HAF family extracellular repeat protein